MIPVNCLECGRVREGCCAKVEELTRERDRASKYGDGAYGALRRVEAALRASEGDLEKERETRAVAITLAAEQGKRADAAEAKLAESERTAANWHGEYHKAEAERDRLNLLYKGAFQGVEQAEAKLARVVEALEKLTTDAALQGRIFKGNAELPGCEEFYRGYNSGVEGQFQYARDIASAALAAARDQPTQEPVCRCTGDGHKPDCEFWKSLGDPKKPEGGR
jgi:hypothetical protein